MEEEAPSRRSVAELAGKFKVSVPPHDAAARDTEKPVRRRPPRTLHIPKPNSDEQQPVTSPLPTKAKRNSALIEKLQANLVLSPTALLPSPKSPGFRLLPPAFTPPSPGSAPVSMVTSPASDPAVTPSSPLRAATSPLTEEEGPASFEAPPTATEGSILPNINKSRARHSIRRRPPSRHHRTSSSGEDVQNEGRDETVNTPSEEPAEKKTATGEGQGGEDVFKEEDKTDTSTNPEEMKSQDTEKDQPEVSEEPKEEEEEKETEIDGEDGASSQEEKSGEKLEGDSTAGATNTESKAVEGEKSEEPLDICEGNPAAVSSEGKMAT